MSHLRTDDNHSWSTKRIKVFIYDMSLTFNGCRREDCLWKNIEASPEGSDIMRSNANFYALTNTVLSDDAS